MNFTNLNDVEFEYLCKDVMTRRLGIDLERFGKGKDGGIDLTDDAYHRNIVIQVKHYIKTDFNGLLQSLKKEVEKVKKINPKQYYVCCSKELTPQNKAKIFSLFKDYMDSSANIITAIEISDFLENPENIDILRKHFKLWIDSTSILSDFLSNDVFIDSEVLLAGIDNEVNLFVRTAAFEEALKCLENNKALIIIGNPGVGKTITSKMIVLYYASLGYRVRYTTDGTDLKGLKRSLSQSPDTKEVILLDDCFGQAYFNMKETQGNELIQLIKYVNIRSNKVLIMNSRVTIYNEAEQRTQELIRSFDREEYKAYILNLDNISLEEKAKIFYNHLFFSEVPQEYFDNIKEDKKYRDIVKHKNYNPRIVDFVCSSRHYSGVDPCHYADYILECLDNPDKVWTDEYERRLTAADRHLLTTVHSLTNTYADFDLVKRCYELNISNREYIDHTINHFEQSLARLQESMLSIVDVKGSKMIGVINPSINDFLRIRLESNPLELKDLLSVCNNPTQFSRLMSKEDYDKHMYEAFKDHSILSYFFENDDLKNRYIAWYCSEHNICDNNYRDEIVSFLLHHVRSKHGITTYFNDSQIVIKLFSPELDDFYNLKELLLNAESFYTITEYFELNDLVEFVNQIEWLFDSYEMDYYINISRLVIRETAEWYYDDVPVDAYDIDVSTIISYTSERNECGINYDLDAAGDQIEEEVRDIIYQEIADIEKRISSTINPNNDIFDGMEVYPFGGYSLAESYTEAYESSDSSKVFTEYKYSEDEDAIIDYVFDR